MMQHALALNFIANGLPIGRNLFCINNLKNLYNDETNAFWRFSDDLVIGCIIILQSFPDEKEYFPNGKVKEITHWIGNTQVGDYEIYHENGVLANKGQLNRKGCFVGVCYSYYDDGSVMSIEKYDRNGKLITFDFLETRWKTIRF